MQKGFGCMSRSSISMGHFKTNISSEPYSNKHIRKILNDYIRLATVNNGYQEINACDPFARESFTTLEPSFITNDLNEMMPTDYHLEFADFAEMMSEQKQEFDLVFFDPPYSLRQLKDCYDNIGYQLEQWQTQKPWSKGKDILAPLIKPGGYVISFGWHSHGFGTHRGFAKKAVYLFQSMGREERYDTIMTIERKVQTTLDSLFVEIEEE